MAAVGAHCADLERPAECGVIPGDGCPLDRGGTCDDRSCDALYACEAGGWRLVESCPPDGDGGHGASGGVAGAGAGGAAGAGAGVGGCAPATIDHTGEHTGCDQDLVEAPDCPVEAAESCHPCETGCVDFFLCTADGWDLVAYCTDEGEVVDVP